MTDDRINKSVLIEDLAANLAHELGVTKQHGERIKAQLLEFAIEIKRACTEGEW